MDGERDKAFILGFISGSLFFTFAAIIVWTINA